VKVLLINDSSSDPNWGDRAAAFALKAMIREAGGEITASISELELGTSTFGRRTTHLEPSADPGTTPTIAFGARGGAKALAKKWTPPILWETVRSVAGRLNLGPSRTVIPANWEGFEKAASSVAENAEIWPDLFRAVEEADVVIVHGDGCMMGNGLVARTELFLSYLIKKYLGRPVIIVNHTADFSDPDLRRIAQKVYPLFDDIVFRDPISPNRCSEFCAGRYVPDTAFRFGPLAPAVWLPVARRPGYFDVWPDTAEFDPGEPYLCMGGSSALGAASHPSELTKGFALLAGHIRSIYRGQIVLTVADPMDELIFRPIAAALELPLIGLTTPVQQAVDILGNAEAYIGGRWHSGIFALRGGAPIVALSAKTFKMQALSQMAGLSPTTFDIWKVGEEKADIGRQVLEYLGGGEELRKRLRAWAEASARESRGNVAYLTGWPTR